MTEPSQQQPNEPDAPVEASTEDVQTPEATDAPDVEALAQEATQARDDLAEAKTRGDALAELLLTRSIEQATADVLHDVTDLPRDGDYFAEDGTPDLGKIRDAAVALTQTKPYLGRVRGDVHQGAKQTTAVPTWSDIMKDALG